MEDVMKRLLVATALIALVGPTLAQEVTKVTIVAPDALAWKDLPALPKGAQFVVLMGDPTKAGEVFVQRVKLPPNYQIPAHTHPYVAIETVLSGSLGFGTGEKLDTQKGQMLKAGSFLTMPARHAHYAWTGNEETIIQLQTVGPGGIDYINPADDPRQAVGSTTPPKTK
jgi:quercetin dioxygenase-like cupin family protein